MTEPNNKPPFVTVQQFAARHGVKPVTVRLWCAAGQIPGAQKLGRDWIIPNDAARPLMDGRTLRHRTG